MVAHQEAAAVYHVEGGRGEGGGGADPGVGVVLQGLGVQVEGGARGGDEEAGSWKVGQVVLCFRKESTILRSNDAEGIISLSHVDCSLFHFQGLWNGLKLTTDLLNVRDSVT